MSPQSETPRVLSRGACRRWRLAVPSILVGMFTASRGSESNRASRGWQPSLHTGVIKKLQPCTGFSLGPARCHSGSGSGASSSLISSQGIPRRVYGGAEVGLETGSLCGKGEAGLAPSKLDLWFDLLVSGRPPESGKVKLWQDFTIEAGLITCSQHQLKAPGDR